MTVGAGVQQLALFRRSKQYTTLSPGDGKGPQALFFLGLGCELTALALLPLATATVLAALHVACYVLQLAADEERKLMSYERRGCLMILVGCVMVMAWGGERRALQSEELATVGSAIYCLWTLASLVLNCSLRRLGFYEGRPLLESCIPAQITAIGICSLKYFLLVLEAGHHWLSFSLSSVLILASLYTTSSFLGILIQRYDRLVTLASFYVWLVMYQLPSGVTMLSVGVSYTFIHYVVIAVTGTMVTAGAGYVAYYRAEEMEGDSKEKKTAYPPDVDSTLRTS